MTAEGFHYLTENDRANSLPPEITVEMYQNVVDPRLFLDPSVSFALEGVLSLILDWINNSLEEIPTESISVSPKKRTTSLRGSVTSGGMVSKGEDTTGSQEKAGLERMSIRKYNELVIPLSVSAVTEGFDYGDDDPGDMYGDDGDY